jgi:hypothetical protein
MRPRSASRGVLLIDETPLVGSDDTPIAVEEFDAHWHRNGLVGEEEDDSVVHRVFKRGLLGIGKTHA